MTAVFSTRRTRGPDLTTLLEVAGLDLETSPNRGTYIIFLPQNARLQNGEGTGAYDEWRWFDGDQYIVWQGVEPVQIDGSGARQLLFDLALLPNAEPQEVQHFVEYWGLMPPPSMTDPAAQAAYLKGLWASPIDGWLELASECNLILHLFALTAGNQPAGDDWLDPLYDLFYTDAPEEYIETLPIGISVRTPAWASRAHELWEEEKRTNRVSLQQRLLAAKLNSFLTGFERRTFVWDERGRRFEHSAMGVWEIVQAQLAELLSAPEAGVFICSICDKAYPLTFETVERRPRAGVRNFCSDECRSEAKRESNRQSWRRHGETWRPPGSRSLKRKRGDDGTQS